MRIVSIAVILVGVLASSLSQVRAGQRAGEQPLRAAGGASAGETDASSVVNTYCAGCHNGVTRSVSGALLDNFDTSSMAEYPEMWTRAYRQLQAGTMPPMGAARPGAAAYDAVLAAIARALGADAAPPADATGREIAERLALLLWNSVPDAALLQDARRNRLASPAILEGHVTRMLADERARAFVTRFFVPWLGLDRLATADPDTKYFPDYDVSLRDAMVTETELFVLSQLRENRDPIELWNANYTFLNGRLARHYGVPGVAGTEFRRVVLPMPERAGLLGHGSVLMTTSRHNHGKDAAYTSPAARAIWVQAHFLGASAPRPAPNAQPVKPELPITPQVRKLPAEPCVNCHRNFFPLGYALENFDPIGRWRSSDQAGPVDASGAFVDGTPTNGVVALRNVLLRRPDAFRTTITENLLVYASGQPVSARRTSADTLVRARQILHGMEVTRWSSLIAAIVRLKSGTETRIAAQDWPRTRGAGRQLLRFAARPRVGAFGRLPADRE
jgi:hypothetical protein